jgi:hypothetical protein
MNKLIVVLIIVLLAGISLQYGALPYFVGAVAVLELLAFLLIKRLSYESPLFITDEKPKLNKIGLQKFFKHGYDPDLGWCRKPNTSKVERSKYGETTFHIDELGSRKNPGHEDLSVDISCYGDSFTFSRQVNDNETWSWHLSELTKTKVLNFGVGNYGLDQALLRLKRDYHKNKTKIVIMGIVPSTIVRILGIWKHYHDYGNTFGFKPFYTLDSGILLEHKNIINTEERFSHYEDYLPEIRKQDYFYKKFKSEMFTFPYLVSIFSKPIRNLALITIFSSRISKKKKVQKQPMDKMNFLMAANLRLFTPTKVKLFKEKYPVELLNRIIDEFKLYAKNEGFEPILLWMPQKDDLLYIRTKGEYYNNFIAGVADKIKTIDLTRELLYYGNLSELFAEENTDGGHFSPAGNKKVAEIIRGYLKGWKLVPPSK